MAVFLAGKHLGEDVLKDGNDGEAFYALSAPAGIDLAGMASPQVFGITLEKHRIELFTETVDIEIFQRYVDDTVETLAGFEDKNEGLDHLTAKAEQEYEERMTQAKEQHTKNNRATTIFNIIFVAVFILLVFLITRK